MKRIIFIVFAFFLFLELISYGYIKYLERTAEKDILDRSNQDYQVHVNFAQDYLNEMSKIFYEFSINNKETAKILYEAGRTSDKNIRAALRTQLYKRYLKAYHYMQEEGIRQFHFHLPNAVSFLRFHRPEKFGDSLLGIRPSIEYVNKTKKPIHCFEEGRIFNAFRNVYPLFYDQIFVGTVEISYAFDALQKRIYAVDHSSAAIILMKNSVINAKVFSQELQNYKTSEFSGFSYDENTLKDDAILSLDEIHYINEKLAKKALKKIKRVEQFSITFHDERFKDGKYYAVDFLPIRNIKQEHVAYIVHYNVSAFLGLLEEKIRLYYMFLSLTSLLLSIIVFILLYMQFKREEDSYIMATHDPLTGIYNRKGLEDILKQKIGEIKRYKRALSVIFFDIDHFKNINDTYGHKVGDLVLQQISQLVSKNIRQSDIFARWGGEEFILFLPETSLEHAEVLAEKLRKIIQSHEFPYVGKVTCSFGVAKLQEGESEDDLLKRADALLYKAKNSGRNRVESFCAEGTKS